MNTKQILLVDDDPMLLQALSHTIALRMSMLEVDLASSAQEALDRLQEQKYDTIVSDIKMPGMDGLMLLDQVQERHPNTPVLLITGHSDHQLAIRALRGGAYDYILKPVDRDDFLAALQRALHTHQLRSQVEEQQLALERYALSLERLVELRTHELEETHKAKGTLLRILPHVLHSHLTSLKNIIQEVDRHLQEIGNARQILTDLAHLKHPMRQMEALVCDIEDSSLLQDQRLTLHCVPCDLLHLCREVLGEDPETGAGFVVETPAESLEVEVDRERFSRVLLHLLSHARVSVPKGTALTIRALREGMEVTLSVFPQSPEISEQPLAGKDELSHPQKQANPLAELEWGCEIARVLVEQHRGRVEFHNPPGEGGLFSLVLPLTHVSVQHL